MRSHCWDSQRPGPEGWVWTEPNMAFCGFFLRQCGVSMFPDVCVMLLSGQYGFVAALLLVLSAQASGCCTVDAEEQLNVPKLNKCQN